MRVCVCVACVCLHVFISLCLYVLSVSLSECLRVSGAAFLCLYVYKMSRRLVDSAYTM